SASAGWAPLLAVSVLAVSGPALSGPSTSLVSQQAVDARTKAGHADCPGTASLGQRYSIPARRSASGTVRPSARADLSVHHRNVGALFLLRHALAARALHDEISASRRSFRQRDRAGCAQA